MQKPEIKIDVVCTSTTGIDIGLLAIGGVSRNALYKFSTYLLTCHSPGISDMISSEYSDTF